ncbi:MAG: ABC transporter substrate-binding protein [Alphaproteobacteria bacterium MedPE-SWcel]|nr:MAG: ABC transporter substrate-binding protein [Alphaproteobacteria bacterium MedPE-SWcel]
MMTLIRPTCHSVGFTRFLSLLLVGLAMILVARPAEAQEFPLTIDHALGTTVIESQPKRIAAIGWSNHEVPLALGVVPVGFAKVNFGDDDDNGVFPWVEARLAELGADMPPLFDEGDGIDFEAVAATGPDLILAAYSGISQSDYDILSKIAPVVAYRVGPWATTWREVIRLNSTAMGRAADGEAMIAEIEGKIAAAVAKHPEIQGKRAMFVTHLRARDLSVIRFYSANDLRVQFFEDLGMVSPQSVVDATEAGRYSGEISVERIDEFDDVDIAVTYGGAELLAALRANPLTARMPVIANNALVMMANDPMGTGANPTPLAIDWVLETYVARLAEAARNQQ